MKFDIDIKNIKYIKLLYVDSQNTERCTKASVKHIEDEEIFACVKLNSEVNIKYPQLISLSIICDNGLYKAKTILKRFEKDKPYAYFYIEKPKDVEFQQKRDYFRVKMFNDVVLTFGGNTISSKVYDISASGISILLNKEINFPDIVGLDISFSSQTVQTYAKYIRTDKEDNILKASFNFIDLSENDTNIISKKCIQKQLEEKRNSLL